MIAGDGLRLYTLLAIPILPQRRIVLNPPLSDDEFERLSMSCDSASIERSKEGAILVNAPAGGMTSSGNNEIGRQPGNWWIRHRRGKVFDSSGGFFLFDGSMLNPDAAYVTAEQLKGLSRGELARFPRLAPAFIIELLSLSDSLPETTRKMEAWVANGVHLGWLIDPYRRNVHVYQQGHEPCIESAGQLLGSGPVEGFALDLEEIWRCYE
jgi:Uma2 family endonuclease